MWDIICDYLQYIWVKHRIEKMRRVTTDSYITNLSGLAPICRHHWQVEGLFRNNTAHPMLLVWKISSNWCAQLTFLKSIPFSGTNVTRGISGKLGSTKGHSSERVCVLTSFLLFHVFCLLLRHPLHYDWNGQNLSKNHNLSNWKYNLSHIKVYQVYNEKCFSL